MSQETLFEYNSSDRQSLATMGKMLLAMASIGAGGDLLSVLLNFATDDRLHPDHRRYLEGPVVQHKSQWMETTPPWLYKAVPHDRLAIVLDELQTGQIGWQVGPAEITAAVYPATMDSPIAHQYAQIYFWAGAQANARHYNKPVEFYWQQIGARQMPDEEFTTPQGQFHYAYRELCVDIRRKVISAQKAREKPQERRQANQVGKPTAKASDVQGEQLELF